MSEKRKKKKWVKIRHKIVRNLAAAVLYPYCRLKYGIEIEKFKEREKRQYLILMNHQTAFDQFFVGMTFKDPVYYVASEDIFSNGWISRLLQYLVAPIPIKKQATDFHAVRTCLRVAKEGGTIAVFPEGNRTYSGKTEYIKPSIVGLVRVLKLPLVFMRQEGGYGVQPRWSDNTRKGKMRVYVSKIIEPETYKNMTDEELFSVIRKELDVNEGAISGTFYHKKSAEYLERAIYVCPHCGLSRFESRNDVVECKKCGRKIRYLPTKELKGEDFQFPFRFVTEWYDYQCAFVNSLDLSVPSDSPLYEDDGALSEVILYKNKKRICKNAHISLYSDKITIKTDREILQMPFEKLSVVTVLGRNKLNIYYDGKIYQIKSDKRFNALKYVNIYYRKMNIDKGDVNGKFLGL